jgi:hypothetical protein
LGDILRVRGDVAAGEQSSEDGLVSDGGGEEHLIDNEIRVREETETSSLGRSLPFSNRIWAIIAPSGSTIISCLRSACCTFSQLLETPMPYSWRELRDLSDDGGIDDDMSQSCMDERREN